MQKKLKRMTAMEQTEALAVEARKQGMKYGEFVEKYGEWIPAPKTKRYYPSEPDEEVYRRCKVCRKEFLVEHIQCGRLSARKTCPACVEALKAAKEARKLQPKRRQKEIERICDRCGNKYTSTQSPAEGRKGFCPECRPIVKREYAKEQREIAKREKMKK